MEAILTVILVVGVVVIYGTFSWGFVASKFYGWFILPSFPELPEFSIVQFVGFMLFLSVFLPKHDRVNIKDEYKESKINEIVILVIAPWVTLILGWMMYSFFF